MSRGRHFSQEELEFIKVNSTILSIGEIAEKLGRNYWSVHRIIQGMGVKRNHKFTPEDDFLLRQLYGKYNAHFIATKLGVDEYAVYNRAKKLGLKKNRGYGENR